MGNTGRGGRQEEEEGPATSMMPMVAAEILQLPG